MTFKARETTHMQDETTRSAATHTSHSRVGRPLLDRILAAVGALLLVAVFAAGVYLAYSIAETRAMEQGSTPRSRLIAELHAKVEESPNDASLRVQLGELYAADGRTADAVRELRVALEIDPEHAGAYLLLGVVALMDKDYAQADTFFHKVLELTEGKEFQNLMLNRELAYFYLGESALDQANYEDAIGYFKATIRMNKSASDAYFGLGMAFKGIEDYPAALEQFEITLAFDPKFAQAHYEMGQIYLAMDDRINAAVHFAESARLEPDSELPAEALSSLGSAEDWETKARSALAAGDTDAALEAALITRALDPESVDFAILHAEVLEAMDKRKDALDVYGEALTLAPDDARIKAAIERLEQQ